MAKRPPEDRAMRPSRPALGLASFEGITGDPVLARAMLAVTQRADKTLDIDELKATYIDVGVIDQLDNSNHQIVFGRRGTGKSHLFRLLAEQTEADRRQHSVYLDLRTIGNARLADAAGDSYLEISLGIFRDILDALHSDLLNESLSRSTDEGIRACQELHDAIHAATIEVQKRTIRSTDQVVVSGKSTGEFVFSLTDPRARVGREKGADKATSIEHAFEEVRRDSLLFRSVAQELERLLQQLDIDRLYLLLDEWASVPMDFQPYVAEFLKRTVFACRRISVKIATLAFRSRFCVVRDGDTGRQSVGLEPGGDIAANIDLDDYYIFDKSPDFVTEVFLKILYVHLEAGLPDRYLASRLAISSPAHLRAQLFETTAAFSELISAGEGVVRDFFGVLGKAFQIARVRERRQIDVRTVEDAAIDWYEDDKVRYLGGRHLVLLSKLTELVVGEALSRYFLVDEADADAQAIQALVDFRLLHTLRRGYTDFGEVGRRFTVYSLDYGAFVNYKRSPAVPSMHLRRFHEKEGLHNDYCFPFADDRGMRRVIVDLEMLEPLVR